MATVVVSPQPETLRHSPSPTATPALTLSTKRSTTPVPNKHIPYCPPGPTPKSQTLTPPSSPLTRSPTTRIPSILYPPTSYTKLLNNPPIYGIDAKTLAQALDQQANQPLPDPHHVFPWLHGLHEDNHIQLAFFVARRKSLRRTPKCLRAITIIKAGGDLTRSRIKGALSPDEVLYLTSDSGKGFLDCDPREGFSVRNFQIQATKMAKLSDIIIYGDARTDQRIIKSIAERTAIVQRAWRREQEASGHFPEPYNTFVLTTPYEQVEKEYPQLIGIDSKGRQTNQTMDFLQWERREMCSMSKASPIAHGVSLGPSPDWNASTATKTKDPAFSFDLFVESSDQAQMPTEDALLACLEKLVDSEKQGKAVHIEFPSSGSILPPSWSNSEIDGLLAMCRFIYGITHPVSIPKLEAPGSRDKDSDGDVKMDDSLLPDEPLPAQRVLIHCADGYTESSLLGLAYYMYAHCVPAHTAWLDLHVDKQRNFFAYPTDVALLVAIQERLLAESPLSQLNLTQSPTSIMPTRADLPLTPPPSAPSSLSSSKIEDPMQAPHWLSRLDGSLPSRVLSYMYLGNLTHANNPSLLKALGITRILSIGEPVSWTEEELEEWNSTPGTDSISHLDVPCEEAIDDSDPHPNMLMVDRVQDNGIDPLTSEFERCLEFIDRHKTDGGATLVHCRVGVSRSATICIAEVMREMKLSFPRA